MVSEIVSFTVLTTCLEKYEKDIEYCIELKEKGKKLMDLVEAKKLGPAQYRQFLSRKIADSKKYKCLYEVRP